MVTPAVPLVVVGAHLTGQPLNHQLTGRGGRLVRTTTTAPVYRLYALDTEPPKPGMVRAAEGDPGGRAIEVELWAFPTLGDFEARCVVAPLRLGPVLLADGSEVTGFLCDPGAVAGATEITGFGGWRPYLASLGGPRR